MCDDQDLSEFDAALARRGLNRRQFAALGAGVLAWACGENTPAAKAPAAPSEPGDSNQVNEGPEATDSDDSELVEAQVAINTPDGEADAFFVHPPNGQHPGVLLWPDVAGLREAFKQMARRLAEQGYAVLAVNPYYRGARSPVMESFSEWMNPEGKAKVQPLREALTPEAITSDAKAYISWLDAQSSVDKNARIGSMGFCMGGPFTVRTAAAAPARVGAAASFHGGGLATEAPDSPHRLFSQTEAGYLIAIAENDHTKEPEAKTTLEEAAAQAKRPAEIEVYPAGHGWTVADSPVYDQAQAERAWERLLALFAEQLKR